MLSTSKVAIASGGNVFNQPVTDSRTSKNGFFDLDSKNGCRFLGKYNPDKVLIVPYPWDIKESYRFLEHPNCLFKRRYLYGVSGCRNISFLNTRSDLIDISLDSTRDLLGMLNFKGEPCYQRPYRLIADSKLCLKGNCDSVSKILRPGW